MDRITNDVSLIANLMTTPFCEATWALSLPSFR